MIAEPDLEPPIASTRFDLVGAVRHLSDRLVLAQRSIRPLEAVAWDVEIERRFLAAKGRELPAVNRDYYRSRPLPFDPQAKLAEFAELESAIRRTLGNRDGVGHILVRMCREYAELVRLLVNRGTREFARISAKLYGSTDDADTGLQMLTTLSQLFPGRGAGAGESWIADRAIDELARRLRPCFPDWPQLRVQLAGEISADAAAGLNYLKLRTGTTFTTAELRLLEVHEGWVHLGTTYNAARQTTCSFLRKGPPSSTRTQEGLAVLNVLTWLTAASRPAFLALLFCGKVAVEDVPTLADLGKCGLLARVPYLPAPYRDGDRLMQQLKNGGTCD
jgi:uncharacterized protein (TIGR02421 family)